MLEPGVYTIFAPPVGIDAMVVDAKVTVTSAPLMETAVAVPRSAPALFWSLNWAAAGARTAKF